MRGKASAAAAEGEVGGHPNVGLARVLRTRTRVPWPTYHPFTSAITVSLAHSYRIVHAVSFVFNQTHASTYALERRRSTSFLPR